MFSWTIQDFFKFSLSQYKKDKIKFGTPEATYRFFTYYIIVIIKFHFLRRWRADLEMIATPVNKRRVITVSCFLWFLSVGHLQAAIYLNVGLHNE